MWTSKMLVVNVRTMRVGQAVKRRQGEGDKVGSQQVRGGRASGTDPLGSTELHSAIGIGQEPRAVFVRRRPLRALKTCSATRQG